RHAVAGLWRAAVAKLSGQQRQRRFYLEVLIQHISLSNLNPQGQLAGPIFLHGFPAGGGVERQG
ncbi:hypothetical protein, partial [Serratia liquefaciens]|uniref:hypothetical protein n=1 Tax=Serratia liquefaciens TaxID=614 RepID=UPI001C436066